VKEADHMIVIGVDVHKHSLTAVAVNEAGRLLDEMKVGGDDDELLGWAAALADQRAVGARGLSATDAVAGTSADRGRRAAGAGAAKADGAGAARGQSTR
jgi:hypothetical protein